MGIFNGLSKTLRAARGKRRYYELTRREKNEMNRNKRASLKAESEPIVEQKIRSYLQGQHVRNGLERLYNKRLSYDNYTPEERNQMIFVRHAQLVNAANDRNRMAMTNMNLAEGNNSLYRERIEELQQGIQQRQQLLEAHRAAYASGVKNGGRRTRRVRRVRH